MKATIAVVEDDTDLLELLEYRLGKEGFDVVGFTNTKNVKQVLTEEPVDLIIMDRNLPDVEGSEYIAMLRYQGLKTPVIFLSAKDSSAQVQEGFLRGGDDYITKPFEIDELILRIKAVLRRTRGEEEEQVVTYRDIELHLHSREAFISGMPVELTKLEFNLLRTFIENRTTVLRRDYLLKSVWGKSDSYQGRTVNVAINRLKEKIDPDKSKDYIKTVRGIGYMIR
ncbi:response regulator transcription factor [Sulfurimonas sp. HSL-3221]|uniref:response regulator transcription factor n=1 Tax=Sulfurimonadaceae TaxID=2771471 RepID=UPI001E41975C|nr:response regulator transcription factor [Sulfurimonas sp. HSL-3221]UFS62002.1 response regulator transcription factor [Sulfurimonas sp. HSL-3221]